MSETTMYSHYLWLTIYHIYREWKGCGPVPKKVNSDETSLKSVSQTKKNGLYPKKDNSD